MGLKGSRNAKKITTDQILDACTQWMSRMNQTITVGSIMFNIRYANGVIFVYNEDGDLLRKFSARGPFDITEGVIKRHVWNKDLVCEQCDVGLFDIQNANGECGVIEEPPPRRARKIIDDELLELLKKLG